MTHRSIRTLNQTSIKTTKYTIKYYSQLQQYHSRKNELKISVSIKFIISGKYIPGFSSWNCVIFHKCPPNRTESWRYAASQSDWLCEDLNSFLLENRGEERRCRNKYIHYRPGLYKYTSFKIVLVIPWSIIQFLYGIVAPPPRLYTRKLY